MTHLPEGANAAFYFYYVSDETGLEIKVSLKGITKISEEVFGSLNPQGVIDAGDLPDVATDWRVMTREEIKDYCEREENGE